MIKAGEWKEKLWKELVNVVHLGNYSMLLNKDLALRNVAAKASVL